jgi:broad specificity phosphatase PhoE
MKVLFVRHAESMGNATGEYSSAQADSLSPRGEKQAIALATSLRAWQFDEIIVSPLQRAWQTIAPYLSATGKQGEIWPELAEACWHEEREPAASSWAAQPASLPESVASLFRYRDNMPIRPAHPESFGTGLARVHRALERLEQMAARSDQTVLMVTHGHFIREILNLMLKTQTIAEFHHDNVGLTLMYREAGWSMDFCNRASAVHV